MGSPLRVVFNSLAIFILSQSVAVFLLGFLLSAAHPGIGVAQNLETAPSQFFYVLLAEGLAVCLVVWILKKRHLSLNAIGWGRRLKFSDITKALSGFVVFYIFLIIATVILSFLFPGLNTNQTQDVGFNHLNSSLDQVLALVALIILPPLGEEILVRGYLYTGLRSKVRFLPAALITSLLFGLAHVTTGSDTSLLWDAGVATFILSMVLVYLRETTGALYAGMILHGLNNLVAFGVHFHR